MPTPTRALTNNYNDCKLVRLDPNDPKSPMVVTQEGYIPGDATFQMRLFFLQRDGFWIDEVARSTRPDNETRDIVFETAAEVIQMLSSLFGKPLVRQVAVSAADVEAYSNRVRGHSSEEIARQFLSRYRASRGS